MRRWQVSTHRTIMDVVWSTLAAFAAGAICKGTMWSEESKIYVGKKQRIWIYVHINIYVPALCKLSLGEEVLRSEEG